MDFRKLFDIFQYQLARYPQKTALAHQEAGKWLRFSTEDCIQQINQVSAKFIELGLGKGDKVGLIFDASSAYFNFLDFGMLQLGIVSIPIHANIRAEELGYILKDAAIETCIVSTESLYQKLIQHQDSESPLKKIFCLASIEGVPSWKDLVQPLEKKHQDLLEKRKDSIQEEDLATIIYTSGTSGTPKGVMLSHQNIISNIKATIALVPVNCDKRVISFLPMSHIFERMVSLTYIAVGASLHYVNGIEQVGKVLRDVKPHYFTSVPKLLERIYEDILERGKQSGRLQSSILNWAIQLGERYEGKRGMGIFYALKLRVARLLVFSRWRYALGGKVEGVVVGAAALQPKLGRLFSAAGIEIREGYGLTETSPVISFNRFEPGGVRFGTVGIPIPGIRVKIQSPDEQGTGEILVKGPGVMLGYYKKAALTKQVLDEEGWFHTGDIGLFVHKRFLKITDRKKDIFKTSSGKYVAPRMIETKLNSSIYIEQSFVFGFNKPYVAALLLPDFDRLEQWCKQHKIHWTAPQYMALNPKVLQKIEKEVKAINEKLANTEKVKKFSLLYQPWTVATGELTPTLKLKRGSILKKYAKEIEELF